ncbi:MAG: leucine-rich repeat domain-containing protein, partial [Bacilli bacterium]|nr:leucine-rich repeat domain-containing protein [Bacilli bacterium]
LNDVSFSKLLSNNRYLVVVRFIKDLNNGEEEVSYQEYVRTLAMAKPSIDITLDSTKTTINYSYKITDSDNISTLKAIKLYYNNKEVEGTNNLYTNLLSNNTYKLVITLLNDYHDGRDIQEETYTKEIKTKALEDIELDIKLEALKREINYKHTLVDFDGISKIVEIKLYLGNKLIKATKDLTEKEFTDLFSNTTYRVIYVVEKDFNDGLGVQTFEYEATTKTLALMIPVISMSFTSNAESINYKLITVDNDQIINHVKLDVYNGDILIKTITKFDENIINELESNTLYTFRLSYTYNLNENSDDLTTTIDYVYSTLAYNISISKLEVLNETSPKTNEDVNIKFYLDNKSNIKVSYLIINSEKYNILGGDSLNNVIIIMKAPQMSGQMNVKVERMGYIINGVTVEQEVEGLNNLNIEIFSRLDIIDISLVNGTNFDKDGFTLGYIIKIDNPKNYLIKEIAYYLNHNLITESNLQIIDNNHLYLMANFYESTSIKMHYVKYIDETGNECVRNYTSKYVFTFKPFYVDQFTFSLSVHQITTPEEFMNMDENSIYELVNDLDMTGYSWNPYLFKGYFDGKGHTVSNLTYVHEDKWEVKHNESYDLITNILALQDATFKNVYFKDLYVDVDTTGIDTTSPSTNNYPFKIIDKNPYSTIENVLISGYLNYKYDGKNLSGVFKYEGYIVDHLYLNNMKIENDMVITNELFNSKDFKENTLGWNFKEKEVKEYDGLIYSIIDNSYIVIIGYKGENENIVIPSVIDGLPVIAIDDLAFLNNKTIKSVELAESLLTIGGSILSGCSNLEKLVINNISIFGNAKSLFGRIEYDNSYSTGGYYVPSNFTNLTINGDAEIPSYVFNGISTLTDVTIDEGITSIGSNAFANCSSLTTLKLPGSLRKIDYGAFNNTNNINIIYFNGTIEDWCHIEMTLVDFDNPPTPVNYDSKVFMKNGNNEYEEVTEITIPDSITKINDYQFYNFNNVTKLILNRNITSIGNNAFYGCALTEVLIPISVKEIGNTIFSNRNATIYCEVESKPDGWNDNFAYGNNIIWGYVGTLTQDGITYLIKTDHAEVTSIEDTDVIVPETVLYNGISYNVTTICNLGSPKDLTSIIITNGIKTINDYAFNGCTNLKEVNLPNSLKYIGSNAFNGCNALEKIIIPNEIETINDSTFYGCTNLKEVNLPNSLKRIGSNVFIGCKVLERIILPNGIEIINDYTFNDCINLKEVNFPNTLQEIGEGTFNGCNALEKIILHNGIKTIKTGAFYGCNNLKEVYLPKEIENIGNSVFDSTALIFVEEESCPSGWDSNWNSGAYDNVIWGYVGTLTQDGVTYIITTSHAEVTSIEGTNVRIPEKVLYDGNEYPVTTIKANSITSHIDSLYISKTVEILEPQEDELSRVGRFYFGAIHKLESWSEYISEDINFVGQFVFDVQGFVETENIDYFIQGNSAVIYKIKVDDPSIPKSIEFNGTSYNVTSIYNLGSPKILTKITIQEGITSIGFYAFNGCTNLREVNLPNTLQEISQFAFSSSGIKSINIPGSVNTIGQGAFADCTNLTTLTINKGVKNILLNAFFNCSNLQTVFLPTGIEFIGVNVFDYSLSIKAEDESRPEGWDVEWKCRGDLNVIWGYKKEE